MASNAQLKIAASALLLSGLAVFAAALLRHQPLLLPVGAILIGLGRMTLLRVLQRTPPR